MTVYVLQDQVIPNRKTGKLESKFDFSTVEEFGELEIVLDGYMTPYNTSPVLERLHSKLSTFGENDYLLLTGSPILMGIATAIAADYVDGDLKFLQWSGAKKCYIPVRVEDIFLMEKEL